MDKEENAGVTSEAEEPADKGAEKAAEEAAETVTEEEGAAESGGETGNAEAGPAEEDEGKLTKGEIPGLSESAQDKVNARIHEINIRRKNAEADLAKNEQILTETKERLKSLETLSDENLVNAAKRAGLLPQYLEKEEAKVIDEVNDLKAYRMWLRQHRDGYEGTGEKDPSMTSQEISAQEIKVEDRLEEIGGKARGIMERVTSVLREDLMEGQRVRRMRKAKPAEKKATRPPVLPSGKGSARTPPIGGVARARAAFNEKEFIEKGGNSAALEEQYERILS